MTLNDITLAAVTLITPRLASTAAATVEFCLTGLFFQKSLQFRPEAPDVSQRGTSDDRQFQIFTDAMPFLSLNR